MIGRSVRIGRPSGVFGLAEATGGAAFASTIGLIQYSFNDHLLEPTLADATPAGRTRRFGQIGNWFKQYIWDAGSR